MHTVKGAGYVSSAVPLPLNLQGVQPQMHQRKIFPGLRRLETVRLRLHVLVHEKRLHMHSSHAEFCNAHRRQELAVQAPH